MKIRTEEPLPVVLIYNYSNFSSYFSAYLENRKQLQSSFSFRWLCRRMGTKSASHLNMIANGKRLPTNQLLEKFKSTLNWSAREFEYATALVGLQKAESNKEKAYFEEVLEALRPGNRSASIALDSFSYITNWHHIAILEMTSLKDFVAEPKWISQRLAGAINFVEADESLALLQRLQLIHRQADGTIIRNSTSLLTSDNIPSVGIRLYHKQMLAKAVQALDDQSVTERYFRGATFNIDPKSLPEAQALIFEFERKFIRILQKNPGIETYHFSAQFFRLTAAI